MAVIVAEILLSLFAVFGLYAAVRLLTAAAFIPTETVLALEIRRNLTVREAEVLLERTRESRFIRGNGKIIALVDAELLENEELICFLESACTRCYYTDFENEEEGG